MPSMVGIRRESHAATQDVFQPLLTQNTLRNVMDMDFVLFIVLFFNCLGVYFIVRSGTGPWAPERSFRLLLGPTVSRAVGEFE